MGFIIPHYNFPYILSYWKLSYIVCGQQYKMNWMFVAIAFINLFCSCAYFYFSAINTIHTEFQPT